MNRITYINKINTYAARFVVEVEGFNATSLYDINIHAESFLIPVLNEVFGLRLENLNATQKKNFPAIDLADFESKVAFQITATSDLDKIRSTLEKFKEKCLDKTFDILYVYIITQRKEKYNEDKLLPFIPTGFSFSAVENVIDKDNLLEKISAISSTPRIAAIAKIYEHEFSDFQIAQREKQYSRGYLKIEEEVISPNMLNVSFPEDFYQAELNIDEYEILEDLNSYLISINKRPVKRLDSYKLVKKALRKSNVRSEEWILYENKLYTFRNLDNSNEPFREIVDIGTITKLNCRDFYDGDENLLRVFKNLLRNTFIEFCKLKEIEWYGKQGIFRFANNQAMPNQKRIKWKGKNEATKTVIFEMLNKDKSHVVCFRSLAFRCSFANIGSEWFLIINPTWSFTNPGGYDVSRFEPDYMSGIKRLETNGTVYNFFRFFSYYFSYKDLFTPDYPYLTITPLEKLTISPKLEEQTWKPAKFAESKSADLDIDIKLDTELQDSTTLF
jgi:hypothetical protein